MGGERDALVSCQRKDHFTQIKLLIIRESSMDMKPNIVLKKKPSLQKCLVSVSFALCKNRPGRRWCDLAKGAMVWWDQNWLQAKTHHSYSEELWWQHYSLQPGLCDWSGLKGKWMLPSASKFFKKTRGWTWREQLIAAHHGIPQSGCAKLVQTHPKRLM